MRLITLLLLCFALVGHAQELSVYKGEVLVRNGLSYKPFTNEPLTAKVERYHENGQLKVLYTVINGKREGLHQLWYENGQLNFEFANVNGKQEGLGQWWHENGQLRDEVTYVNGKLEGLGQRWYENGEANAGDCYKAGEKTDMAYCDKSKESQLAIQTQTNEVSAVATKATKKVANDNESSKPRTKEDVTICVRYLMAPTAEIYNEALSELHERKLLHADCDGILRARATEEISQIESKRRREVRLKALIESKRRRAFKGGGAGGLPFASANPKLPKPRSHTKDVLAEEKDRLAEEKDWLAEEKVRSFWVQVLRRLDETEAVWEKTQ